MMLDCMLRLSLLHRHKNSTLGMQTESHVIGLTHVP